ncbi:MAG: hypothetical protein MRY72_10740 [Aquisalinus sp.]|nr:hypothetical protein [Aquisalinus sp.]
MKPAHAKLIAAIILDIADFTVGRILGFGTAMDMVMVLIAFAMFGWKGLFSLWEVADLSDQVDGFVPTLTLIALSELRDGKKDKAADDHEPEAIEQKK